MSVPSKTSNGSEAWILDRSLDTHVLPKWLQEVSFLLAEVSDGDTIYVKSRLDKIQLEAGAAHLGKHLKIEIDPEPVRGKMIKIGIMSHEVIEIG